MNPVPRTAISSDQLCLRLLAESGLFSDAELTALNTWRASVPNPEAQLADFLARQKIFQPRASEELGLLQRGYVSFSTIHHLFLPGSHDLLRQRVRPHLPDADPASLVQTVRGPASSDTVRMRLGKAPEPPAAEPATKPLRQFKREIASEPAIEAEPPATHLVSDLPVIRPRRNTEPGPTEATIGIQLGSYRLLGRIGRGPRATVFEAEDVSDHRKVAVKVLAPEMISRGAAWPRRFLREARLVSRLDHPLIINVLNVGQEPGLVYFAMPFIKNGSTKEIVEANGPYPPIEATRIAKLAARALAAAHGRGLAHGNLKPSNVFAGEGDDVRIADFTIPNLSPEEAADSSEEPAPPLRPQDIAGDLRLLAATYHWLLTGKQLAEGEAESGAGPLPQICQRIIQIALARRRAGYPSAGEMAKALAEAEESLRVVETSNVAAMPMEDAHPKDPVPAESSDSGISRIEVGQFLGKCLLTERVGQGSSGAVFRARHQTLNIPVAVKVLHVSGPSGVFCQLKSEARLLAQLNHPHIVRVWDFEDDPALPYLVLEYVEGPNLADLIQRDGRLSARRALQIITQIASGLAAAHKLGIVHRDVKPGNILLAREGTAKLADMGLAVFVDRDKGGRPSGMVGTVAYMPPEQATAAGVIDHRSDIYSLGATFYHLVTGKMPFQGSSRKEVIFKHANETPLAPHELMPYLPRAVSAVILKMMAKNPANRYQTYEELLTTLSDLGRLLSGASPSGQEASPRASGE